MSSMGNSQDDAQDSSSESKKLNSQSAQNQSQEQRYQPNQVSSIKSISDKLNEPLLGQSTGSQLPTASHAHSLNENKHDSQSINNESTVDTEANQHFNAERLGVVHPNFDAKAANEALDPNRPLTDIPAPAARYKEALSHLLTIALDDGHEVDIALKTVEKLESKQASFNQASLWVLIASPALASHLELLQLGGLINLPPKFFDPVAANAESPSSELSRSEQYSKPSNVIEEPTQLLAPLTEMTLLDMSDIHRVCLAYPNLSRYGFLQTSSDAATVASAKTNAQATKSTEQTAPVSMTDVSSAMPEMINDVFAPSWELILYPERFDNGVDSLTTDILACSVAVHVLKQCATRKTPNRGITAQQICQHMRSYVLSQCNIHPQLEQQYRQIRLFVGHVVVAAHYLGVKVTHATDHAKTSSTNSKGEPSANLGQPIYLNVSAKASLFTRYPDISRYYINGWS